MAVIDLTAVNFFTYSGVELPVATNTGLFVTFSIIFAISTFLLLNSVRQFISEPVRPQPRLNSLQAFIFATQIVMTAIIASIILQMIVFKNYNIVWLQAATYLTHFSAILSILLLVSLFVSWLKSRRSHIILLYMVCFLLISTNIIISMMFLEYHYSLTRTQLRKPYPITSYVIRQDLTPFTESLATIYDVLSLLSFSVIWVATLTLLSQYRYKLGRVKFYIILSIPLIYYLFPFQGYFGNIFSPLAVTSPVVFGIIYVLTFSATKQVGALLFSLAFLTASTLIAKDRVRKSLLISAIGMAILFGSINITTLQYRLYPPFGLVTQAFMPLGAYMLFIGIFTSATGVSRDAALRKEFYKSAMSQLNLLKTIGVTQMEKELLREYKPVLARSNELEEPRCQPLEQSDVKEIIHDVLQELQARENFIAKNRSNNEN